MTTHKYHENKATTNSYDSTVYALIACGDLACCSASHLYMFCIFNYQKVVHEYYNR